MAKSRMYMEARAKGKTPRAAGDLSTVAGVAEGYLEKIGLDFMLKKFGKPIATHLIHMASEGLQELSQSGAESAIAELGGIRDEDIGTILRNAGYEGLIGVILGGGASTLIHHKDALVEKGIDEKVAEKTLQNVADRTNKEAEKMFVGITPEELDKIGAEIDEFDRSQYINWWQDIFKETHEIRAGTRGRKEVLGRLREMEEEGLRVKEEVETEEFKKTALTPQRFNQDNCTSSNV